LSSEVNHNYRFSLKWQAHLARDFTGGTPVPLSQTEPVPNHKQSEQTLRQQSFDRLASFARFQEEPTYLNE
jgi:hypothetical protein